MAGAAPPSYYMITLMTRYVIWVPLLVLPLPQAPWELLLGPDWATGCRLGPTSRCGIPHLLGLCKLQQWSDAPPPDAGGGGALGGAAVCVSLFLHSAAAADVLLAVLLRLQQRLQGSELYCQVSTWCVRG